MTPKFAVSTLVVVAAAMASPALHAASPGDMEKEYQQIRAVALRDPKVRAAYAEADRKLEAKIVQIDPALAGYRSRGTVPQEKAESTPKPAAAHTKPSGGFHAPHSSSTAQASAPATHTPALHATHTVTSGETLGGIASQYGVSVAALKSANHIADEKKLAVGQVLTIPAKKSH